LKTASANLAIFFSFVVSVELFPRSN